MADSADSPSLATKIADELRRNDECGVGPLSEQEYMDDAVAILRIVQARIREMADEEDYATMCSWKALAYRLVSDETDGPCTARSPGVR